MNKAPKVIVMITLLLALFSLTTFAEFGPIRVLVDDQLIKFPDAQPFIDSSSRTQVPARFVSEALGANVAWDNDTRVVTIKKGTDVITLKVGENAIHVNGKVKQLDTKALIKQDRTFVPLRFVSEALGAGVTWEASTLTASISTKPVVKADTVVIRGYTIPVATKMTYSDDDYSDKDIEEELTVQMLFGDVEQQKVDIRSTIASKFGNDIANQVYNHIKPKKQRYDDLDKKEIYIASKKQYIEIRASGGMTIELYIFYPGIDPNHLKD